MNKTLKKNPFTFIVQAQKIVHTYSDGENLLKPLKAHYFKTLAEVEKFLPYYINVLKNDPLVTGLDVSSKYSVNTCHSVIANWHNGAI